MGSARGNQGIVQSGGTLTAGALAVGSHARAEHSATGKPSANVHALLAELEALIRSSGLEDSERLRLQALVEEVTRQVGSRKPNRAVLEALLDTIAGGVKSVATIAQAVVGIKGAVVALF